MASPWEVRSAPFSSSVLGIPSLTLSACRVQFCLLANLFTVATSAFENLMEAKDSFLGSKMLTGINNSVAESILWAPGLLRSPVRKPLRVHGLEPSVLWDSVSYFYHSVSLKKKMFIDLAALPLRRHTWNFPYAVACELLLVAGRI